MSKRFTTQFKLTVLALLDANGGNIALTAAQASIAPSTLYAWRSERAQFQHHAQQLQEPLESQEEEVEMEVEEAISQLHDYVLESALRIAATLPKELESPLLFHKVHALNGLLDRLTKFAKQYPAARPDNVPVLRVEYVDEYGRVYDSPPDEGFDDEEDYEDDEEASSLPRSRGIRHLQ